jgi:hypothetical protein
MAQSYKPYTATTYASGERQFDIYNFDVQDVIAKQGNSNYLTFSNPFCIIACYSFVTGRYLKMQEIFEAVLSIVGVSVGEIKTPSGVLIQRDNGGDFDNLGNVNTDAGSGSMLMQIAPLIQTGEQIFQDDNQDFVSGDQYPQNVFNLLNDFSNFDALCIPVGTQFTLSDPYASQNDPIMMTILVKRGDNQPFFNSILT